MHVASRRGHADIVQLLFKHGADRKAQDVDGRTPLHRSSEYGHVEVARILLEHGADTVTRDNLDGSPLERASMRGYVELVRLLLKHGADVNTKDNDGRTPLHLVSLVGRVGVARVLLEHGVTRTSRICSGPFRSRRRPNAGYNYNQSLLRCASGTAYPEVAWLVLDPGADANSCAKDNENLLHLASQCHASIVRARSEEHDVIITARHLYSTRDSDQLP